ncbi:MULTISPECIES: tol-pal system-associated acyl-CoA thioesterase [Caballeronia]|uniref:4-hydroxybenzoyl-CoA thioesterase n=1 Tax=Caballeronia cordobensis TaxID=1353886 RepID=A0A158JC12_CABCO|nr:MULTISPECIES: tol-pal system-associated acyl-CoA thioesterase [Caballeronia]AET90011.1 tol-pal system-associated acyl-CoA thioesterase [Burkholderia sp. YI23]BAO87295.1 tol-pal system-associated acyl-coA thioesterase [Burkholderia sp. RPE67]MCE4540822.1 tol-pal system-associated acyl-CoA thioesterase [Caballeronia sp. PC1]MCE4570135.1 tol-pal system-associated acyl-CoA thioesterase [Caballeronia sp. CLC5]SAL66225.1 4-hydroxybenzoyl-CoA thioesterase [Caballeronia cordobensis]
MSDPLIFEWPIRVYYEDTDAGGIVFYANYLKFFERARTEWLRACGIDQQRLADANGIVFVVRRTSVDYTSPARLDDVIRVASRIERLGRASVDFHQEAWRDGVLLASGDIRVASVDRASMRPAPIPDAVLDGLKRGPHAALATASSGANQDRT